MNESRGLPGCKVYARLECVDGAWKREMARFLLPTSYVRKDFKIVDYVDFKDGYGCQYSGFVKGWVLDSGMWIVQEKRTVSLVGYRKIRHN